MARCRSLASNDCTPRSSSGESVGSAMPISASDVYSRGSNVASAAPPSDRTARAGR